MRRFGNDSSAWGNGAWIPGLSCESVWRNLHWCDLPRCPHSKVFSRWLLRLGHPLPLHQGLPWKLDRWSLTQRESWSPDYSPSRSVFLVLSTPSWLHFLSCQFLHGGFIILITYVALDLSKIQIRWHYAGVTTAISLSRLQTYHSIMKHFFLQHSRKIERNCQSAMSTYFWVEISIDVDQTRCFKKVISNFIRFALKRTFRW